jgi:hydroxymethylglutaryl-CoA lyase
MGPRKLDGAPRSEGVRSDASSIAGEDTTHYAGAVALFEHAPDRVSVYEVSLRDGLQNERATVPLRHKLRLVDALCMAGLKRIEITSFVSPKWIPQLADADELAEHANAVRPEGVTFSALCPNAQGLARAQAHGVREIAVFVSASETHNKKNVNKTIAATLAAFEETVGPAREAGMRVRAYVSTVWGCPYEGEVDPRRALDIAQKLLAMGCYQVSLSDTIGTGTPRQTERLLGMALAEIPREKIAMHMHDTRGTALPNVLVGLEMGVRDFDASVGGMGGCPYAPGAAGNLATEDLVYMLHGMGIETGIDIERLWEAGKVAESIVGRPLPGKVHQAGVRSLKA